MNLVNNFTDDDLYFEEYEVDSQEELDKIKSYLDYNEGELQLGNVFVNLMFDNNTEELLAVQVVDTESSTWDLNADEAVEIFGEDALKI